MTPAQEAKEFAAAHGLLITQVGRRYVISDEMKLAGEEFANVGGYPAALNAMKRYVEELKDVPVFPLGWKVVDTSVEEGETRVPDAGAPTLEVPVVSGAVFDKPVYTQQYGRAERPVVKRDIAPGCHPAVECCMEDPCALSVERLPRPKIIEALKTYGIQFTPGTRSGDERGPMATVSGPKWRVWQRSVEGFWRPLIPFASRAEAVKYCRQLANIRSLRNLTREIRYEV